MKETCRKDESTVVPGVTNIRPVLLVPVIFCNVSTVGRTFIVSWSCKGMSMQMSMEVPCRYCGTLLKRFKDTADQDVCPSLECAILMLREFVNNQVGGAKE